MRLFRTRASRAAALAEIQHRLCLEPVWPSRFGHELHCIAAETNASLRSADVQALSAFGADIARSADFDDAATQAIAAAAFYLDDDGLIVPGARRADANLVIVTGKIDTDRQLALISSAPVYRPARRATGKPPAP